MAISSTAIWEMRTTGDNTNGGFYKSDAGTTDYSQQATAELSLTDLVSDTAGTGISSATGGFTAAMLGNGFRIESTGGFTAGWYEITAYTDTNNITIDRSAGASKTGGSGKVGGAVALPTDALMEARVAGNTMYMKTGTYTLTETISIAQDGTTYLPIRLIGYNTTRGDNPTGTDRPLIAGGSYEFSSVYGNYQFYDNIRITTTYSNGFTLGSGNRAYNVKVTNTAGGVPYGIRNYNNNNPISDCEVSGGGYGIYTNSGATILNCYVHDCFSRALYIAGNSSSVIGTIITNSGDGMYMGNHFQSIINCTLDNNTNGINIINGYTNLIIRGNQITNNTTGINATVDYKGSRYIDYNNYYGNTTDISVATKGDNATATNPVYTDSANGDFSITATDIVGVTPIAGSATDNNMLRGAWQRAGGGGSTEKTYGYIG